MSVSNADFHVSALIIFTESLERIVGKEVAFLCPIFFCIFVLRMVVLISVYNSYAPFLYSFIQLVFRRFCVIFANLIFCFMYLLHFQVEEETRKAVMRRWKHKVQLAIHRHQEPIVETKVGRVCLLSTRDKFRLPRNAFKLWLVFPTASFNFRFVFFNS